MEYLYLAIAILTEVTATSALKASEQFTKPESIAVKNNSWRLVHQATSPIKVRLALGNMHHEVY
jgi:multidrug transporter EmrE-like cation transporter